LEIKIKKVAGGKDQRSPSFAHVNLLSFDMRDIPARAF
jgi:hypothetical protein